MYSCTNVAIPICYLLLAAMLFLPHRFIPGLLLFFIVHSSCVSVFRCFTLHSFAGLYAARQNGAKGFSTNAFASRLWGDFYFDTDSSKIVRQQSETAKSRTFVQFILEPIYKIYRSPQFHWFFVLNLTWAVVVMYWDANLVISSPC
jgi:hypothetical protein